MSSELVLTGSRHGEGILSVTDLHTGSHVQTFKQNASCLNAAAATTSSVFAAQNDKATINIYRWNKESVDQKIILPEKLDAIAISHTETWLAGGSASGKLYIWEIASGILLFVKDAHYQGINVLRFSEDDLILFTGSLDAIVKVWRMVDVVGSLVGQELIKPINSLTQHSLAITDIRCSTGPAVSARLYTSSMDNTIKVWDLVSGELISTLLLPSPPTCIDLDPAERRLYAGTSSGDIYEIPLYVKEKQLRAVGGLGTIVNVGDSGRSLLQGQDSPITAIKLSFDGSRLVSGAENGSTFVWDCPTRQMISKLKQHDSAVTILLLILKDMSGAPSSKAQTAQWQSLKRQQTERERDEHLCSTRINHSKASSYIPAQDVDAAKAGLAEMTTSSSDSSLKIKLQAAEEELKQVFAKYEELRNIHEQLWKEHVKLKASQS